MASCRLLRLWSARWGHFVMRPPVRSEGAKGQFLSIEMTLLMLCHLIHPSFERFWRQS